VTDHPVSAGVEAPGEGRLVEAGRLFTLLAGPAIVGLIAMAIASITPRIAAEFGGANAALAAQLVMTLPAVMVLVGAPVGGWLADRVGHRPVLLTALAVYALAGAAGLFITDFATLMASRLLLGLAGGAIQPVCLALIGRYYDGVRRERVLGFVVTVSSILAIAGLTLGGAIADLLGWRAAFSLYLVGAVVFLTALRCVPAGGPIPAARGKGVPGAGALAGLWPVYALVTMLGIGMFLPAIQAPFLLEAKGVGGATVASLPGSACAAVATLSSALYGRLRRRWSIRGVSVLTALSMGGGAVLAAQGGLAPTVLGCALIGIGAGLVEPNAGATILSRTPEAVHARALGLLITALYLGQFLNPLLFAALRDLLGPFAGIEAAGAALLLTGALLLAAQRSRIAAPIGA